MTREDGLVELKHETTFQNCQESALTCKSLPCLSTHTITITLLFLTDHTTCLPVALAISSRSQASTHHVDRHTDRTADVLTTNLPQRLQRQSTQDAAPIPALKLHVNDQRNATRGRPVRQRTPETIRGTLRTSWHAPHL